MPRPTKAYPYQLVFWDFNGTLLDDTEYAIGVRNRIFPAFGLPTIGTVAEYHRQFTFPVRVYYQRAGVTEEQFETVANAWMAEYVRGCGSIPLHGDALEAVEAFHQAGLGQVVLSASQREVLLQQLHQYGLEDAFDAVLGLSHIYATSKHRLGMDYLAACGVEPARCVLLGDTLHDWEVAQKMGVDCILVAKGHQSRETLGQADALVVDSLAQAARHVLGC